VLLAVPAVAISFADFQAFTASSAIEGIVGTQAKASTPVDLNEESETVLDDWANTSTKAQQALAKAQFARIQRLISAITNNSLGIIKLTVGLNSNGTPANGVQTNFFTGAVTPKPGNLKGDLALQKQRDTAALRARIRAEIQEINRLTIQMKKYINELSVLASPFQAKPAFIAPTVTIFAFAGR